MSSAVPGGRARPARQWWVLPASQVPYQHVLRGPRRRWWRPLLALLVLLAIVLVGAALTMVPVAIVGVLAGSDDLTSWLELDAMSAGEAPGPGGLLYLLVSLAVLIPAAMLSIWLVHRVRPGFVSSVAGRLRWRWLLRVAGVVVPVFVLYFGGVTVLGGAEGGRPEHWVALLVISVTLSPFQAAGEEYVFRGWILQNIGSYVGRPLVGLLVGMAVSAAGFAAAHGSADPLIIATLVAMSIATCYLTWRTGGLEAAIVIHATNNIGAGVVGLTVGGYAESFIDSQASGSAIALVLAVALYAVLVGAVVWLARRHAVPRWYEPPTALLAPPPVAGWPGLTHTAGVQPSGWAPPTTSNPSQEFYPPVPGPYPPPSGNSPSAFGSRPPE